MSVHGHRRSAFAAGACTLLAAVLLMASAVPAGAVPAPPPNPSDSELEASQSQASSAATEVGRMAGLVSKTEGDIERLRADLELKGELAKAAIIDVQLANQDAADAQQAAVKAGQDSANAATAVTVAENQAAGFAAASFRQGSVVGSLSSYLDSADFIDLMSREQMLGQVSASQAAIVAKLESARNQKANLESAARQARDQAQAAREKAVRAQQAAQQAQQVAADSFAAGKLQLEALQTQLAQQQQAYVDAMSKVADLQQQRQQYIDWLAAKKAEEERLRQLALEQARKEAARVAAAKAAAEKLAADKAAAQAAAERARAAQVAAQQAAEKAAAEKAAKAKAEADRLARQKAEAARVAAAKAAATKAAADRAAALKAQQEKAAADRVAAEKQRQLAAARQAQQAEARRQLQVEKSKYFADCGAAEKAGLTGIKRGQPGYRVELDRNRNGVACEVLSDSAQQAGNRPPAITPIPTPVPVEVYYTDCEDAELTGTIPIKRGEPGYRIGLDANGNGIACEPSAGGGSSGGGSAPTVPNSGVPSDRGAWGSNSPGKWSSAKGAQAVASARKWIGTPYSWGGGNTVGPTTGICGPSGAWNDCNIVGFDCSGLTSYAWAQVGVSIVALSRTQYGQGQHISRSNLMPGDLLFYANNTSDPGTIHHVAMYTGNGMMIEAPYSGAYVQEVPAKLSSGGYIGAVRPGT